MTNIKNNNIYNSLTSFIFPITFLVSLFLVGITASFGYTGFTFNLKGLEQRVPTIKSPKRNYSIASDTTSILEFKGLSFITQKTSFDQSRGVVIIRRLAYNKDYTYPNVMSRNDYIKYRGESAYRDTWNKGIEKTLFSQKAEATQGTGLINIKVPIRLPGKMMTSGALRVSGSQKIAFEAKSDYRLQELKSEQEFNTKFPALDMEQELKVHLEGTVGDKVSVLVDHDSTQELERKNKIKVRYQGDEDEIVQEVEAGDTQLAISGSQYASANVPHKGLFGARLKAKVGGININAIASKEEGQTEHKTFEGTAVQDSVRIDDTQYIKKTYYFSVLPQPYPNGGINDNQLPIPGKVKLYYDNHIATDNNENYTIRAYAYTDPTQSRPDTTDPSEYHNGDFTLLQEGIDNDYVIDYTNQNRVGSGIISLKRPIGDDWVLAISYETKDGRKIGGTPDPYHKGGQTLKLLKPQNPDTTSITWNYELKNVYYLGGRDINPETFEMKIRKKRTTDEPEDQELQGDVPYIKLLKLDEDGDGRVDMDKVNLEAGIFWFPSFLPFASSDLADPNPIIYKRTSFRPTDSKYYIVASYKSQRTTYNLGQINIIEGSEVVKIDGRKLERDKDYMIIYEIGQITLYEQPPPTARVTIDYEYAPFFMIDQKTLLGVRAEYNFLKNSKLGATWMYESQISREPKPKLGKEPNRIMVTDIDGTIDFQSKALTTIIDKLPLIETSTLSSVSLSGEVAMNIPNPNTRGEVYVDDMESIYVSNSLGTSRVSWTIGSVPRDTLGIKLSPANLGRLIWYNPRYGVKTGEVFPNIQEARKNERLTILEMRITPLNTTNPESAWASLNRLISKTGMDFSERKFIEMWVKVKGPAKGKINIDLGDISEDTARIIKRGGKYVPLAPNDSLDTEDKNLDGKLDSGEDTGLDGVEGDDKKGIPGDDGNDDYYYDPSDENNYERVNGTENNSYTSSGGVPDTEDLDGNGRLKTNEVYVTYTIDLSKPPADSGGTDEKGYRWRLYRIPLNDVSSSFGGFNAQMWENIKYARFWLTGFSTETIIQIASMEVVGNKWLADPLPNGIIDNRTGTAVPDSILIANKEEFNISVWNNQENPNYYAPPGVTGGRDPTTGGELKEQSLVLNYKNLASGHTAVAYQAFHSPQDFMLYRTISFWIHGSKNENKAKFFIRFGADNNNYYEYRRTIEYDWKQIKIPISKFSNIKKEYTDTVSVLNYQNLLYSTVDPDDENAEIIIRGGPTFTNIRRITVGITFNPSPDADPGTVISPIEFTSGEVWFDELMLEDVRKEIGMATRLTFRTQFADLFGVTINHTWRDADFYGMGQSKGTGTDNKTLSIASTLTGNKFLPGFLGLGIPINHSYNRSISYPKFRTGSDIILEEKIESEKSETESQSISTSISRTRRAKNPFISTTIDPLKFSYRKDRTVSKTPASEDTTNRTNLQGTYSLSIPDKSLKIYKGTRFSYLPNSLNLTSTYDLNKAQRYTKIRGKLTKVVVKPTENINSNAGFSYAPFRSLNGRYSLTLMHRLPQDEDKIPFNAPRVAVKDSIHPGSTLWERFLKMQEIERRQSADANYSLPVFKWLSPRLSFNTDYDEQHQPELRAQAVNRDSADVRRVGNTNTARLSLTLKPGDLFSSFRKIQNLPFLKAKPKKVDDGKSKENPNTPNPDNKKDNKSSGDGKDTKSTQPKSNQPKKQGTNYFTKYVKLFPSIQGEFSETRRTRYLLTGKDQITETPRPPLVYQLGFLEQLDNDDLKSVSEDSVILREEQKSKDDTYTANTSITLFSRLEIGGRIRYSDGKQWYSNTATERKSLDWPSLTFSVRDVQKFPVLKTALTSSSIESNYSKKVDINGSEGKIPKFTDIVLWDSYKDKSSPEDLSGITSVSVSTSFNPLLSWSGHWKGGVRTSFSRGKTTTITSTYNNGEEATNTTLKSWTLNAKVQYAFSAPGGLKLPVLKRIKFTSKLDVGADFTHKIDRENRKGEATPRTEQLTYSIKPSASYGFSENVTGGLIGEFGRRYDKKADKKWQTIGLSIWVLFKF